MGVSDSFVVGQLCVLGTDEDKSVQYQNTYGGWDAGK